MAPGLREMLAEALLLAGFGNVTEYGGVVQRGFRGLQAGPKCDQMFLGTDIGWVDVMEYHDEDHNCRISFEELQNVCSAHYEACLNFLASAETTKDGTVSCTDTEMMERMSKGGDVCCNYLDERKCATFPVGGTEDTAEECADTHVVDTTSLSMRMPLQRDCNYWVAAYRFPGVMLPPNSVVDEAYVLFPVLSASDQVTPVTLRILVEGTDNAAPMSPDFGSITSRTSLNAVVTWQPETWPVGSSVQMSADIGSLIAQLTSRPGWEPGNAIVVKIEPGPGNDHIGHRIARAYDENKHLPAVRIVYHTDETIAQAIKTYHEDLDSQVREQAKAEAWSNGQIFALMAFVAFCVAAAMRQYQRKFGRAAGNKYDKVQTEEEARGLTGDDDFGEFDSEGVERDAKGNPVARAYLSEGAKQSQSNFVYRDSSGNVR